MDSLRSSNTRRPSRIGGTGVLPSEEDEPNRPLGLKRPNQRRTDSLAVPGAFIRSSLDHVIHAVPSESYEKHAGGPSVPSNHTRREPRLMSEMGMVTLITCRTEGIRNFGGLSGHTAQQFHHPLLPVAGWTDQTNARKSLIDSLVLLNRSKRLLP